MLLGPATDADYELLIAIEKLTPQGGQIRLVSERKDYFFRAKKFADPIFLVVEDEAEDMILGIMGVGPVTVRLNNEIRRAGLVFDWRSNPLIKKGLPRHMFRLWQAAYSEIVRRDLDFCSAMSKRITSVRSASSPDPERRWWKERIS